MSTIVTRAGKGSTLTFAEVDANFTNLNTDKLEFSSEPVRHSVRPSLLLDFANTKQLDPRITFTRASTATFYDGKTTALAEQNLVLQSNAFTTSPWQTITNGTFTGPTVTPNYATAPDGTTTASRLQATCGSTLNDYTLLRQFVSGTIATSTWSIWVISNTGSSQTLVLNGNNVASTITATTSWQRLSWNGSSATLDIGLRGTYTGGTLDVSIWAAQVENRSAVTAYTPTTIAAITNYIPALQTAASGVARFDHNPTTGESLGLLIEEQRVNLFTYSDDFSNAAWNKNFSTVTANTNIAPDGLQTVDTLTRSITNSSEAMVRFTSSQAVSTTYTSSVFAKIGTTGNLLYFRNLAVDGSTTTGLVRFNLATGAVDLTFGSTYTGKTSITSVGNGWYRCSITGTTTATIANNLIDIGVTSTGSIGGTAGDFLYIWGAQLEAGAFATSYIPTVASQVTRSPDAASLTGTNFSSWYRTDEGTVYAEAVSSNTSSANEGILTIQQGANLSLMGLGRKYAGGSTTTIGWWVYTNAVTQAYLSVGAVTANVSYKVSGTYKTNDIAASFNGAAPSVDTSATLATQTQLFIGKTYANEYLNGTIKKLAYYPLRLTNQELQGLTTV